MLIKKPLLRRLVFICIQEKIPFEIQTTEGNACKLITGTLACKLWDHYPVYPNQVTHEIEYEDQCIKDAPILDSPNQMQQNQVYLYVVTNKGDIFFASQYHNGKRITHAALARKAYELKNLPDSDVLSAGTIMKNNNSLYINLESGHFLPDKIAYSPMFEALIGRISNNDEIKMQFPAHYKPLDARSCVLLNTKNIEEQQALKQSILHYLKKLQGTYEQDDERVTLVQKLFDGILTGEELNYTDDEITMLNQDEYILELFDKYSKYFPEGFSEFIQTEANMYC